MVLLEPLDPVVFDRTVEYEEQYYRSQATPTIVAGVT